MTVVVPPPCGFQDFFKHQKGAALKPLNLLGGHQIGDHFLLTKRCFIALGALQMHFTTNRYKNSVT